MTTRLGLGIADGEVRAVLARGGRVVWAQARAVDRSDNLTEVITELIRSAPLRKFPRTPVIAAIGPALAQVKRLAGVSPAARAQVVSQLVRSNTSRFFLRNGIPLSVTCVHHDQNGWWAGAIDSPAVESVEAACANSPAFFEGCVPAIAAIAVTASSVDSEVDLVDGSVRARLYIREGRWEVISRERRESSGEVAAAAIASRHGLEPRFCDALSAALISPRTALFLRASRSRLTIRQRRSIRAALSVLALTSILAALTAPGVAAARHAALDTAKLEQLRGTLAAWSPALIALSRTTAALNEISRFTSERRSLALLLGSVSEALPDSTAIVNLRVDSTGGTMTLLSLTAASIVPRLASTPAIVEPRIVGAVTRETVNGRQFQRVTVRFGLRRLTRAAQ